MSYFDYFPYPMPDLLVIPLSLIVGLIGFAVGAAYCISETDSKSTLSLAFANALTGFAIMVYVPAYVLRPTEWWWQWTRLPILDALIMCELFAWIFFELRVARPTARAVFLIKTCAWLFAAATTVYVIQGIRYPDIRLDEFAFCLSKPAGCSTAGFWVFMLPVSAMTFFLGASMLILFRQQIDPAERLRAIWCAAATPLFFAVYILPIGYGLLSPFIAYLMHVIGLLHYHRLQSERGVFMSRFLSPEVAKMVRMQGLTHTMQPQKLELTAVCCDLRGFTHFAMEHDSDVVTRLLGEYYEAVGEAVTRFGATIKDYAGDGVLILLGAPVPMPNHAAQGLALSKLILEVVQPIMKRWSSSTAPLGIGVGVASGIVTVGAIGSASRMEYTAVGPAVNTASRLCAQAQDGEILVNERSSELALSAELTPRAPIAAKGLGDVPHFALAPATR